MAKEQTMGEQLKTNICEGIDAWEKALLEKDFVEANKIAQRIKAKAVSCCQYTKNIQEMSTSDTTA